MVMSPPRPPSPPLGPPRGTYFSRRNARQPLPPSPAFTRMITSSMNKEGYYLLGCADADELALPAAVAEFDHAVDLGKQSVILADSDIDAGLKARTALPDDDR